MSENAPVFSFSDDKDPIAFWKQSYPDSDGIEVLSILTTILETGFVRLGTIHSHADLPAYSSAQDDIDEQFEDGLHVVIGSFGKAELSIAASFVANGIRFRMPPAQVLEIPGEIEQPARPEWLACLTTEEVDDECAREP